MIVTRLRGGLGNQMFQYAAGLRLACARGTRLLLDTSPLCDPGCHTPRSYALGPFRLSAGRASPEELAAFGRSRRSLASRLARRLGRRPDAAAVERHFHFDEEVLALPDGVCLRGYWQSERYFADAADRVRRELRLERPPTGRNAELAAEIAACNAVSLHVRRGDYVSDPVANAMHGVCSLDYYRRATELVVGRVPDATFFVFSDDPGWTRDHLQLPGKATVVDHNGPAAGHEDLRLMSLCAHHIIANSSFSWWGAWLDPRPDKIVVAPERWFADGARDTADLCPAAWVKL